MAGSAQGRRVAGGRFTRGRLRNLVAGVVGGLVVAALPALPALPASPAAAAPTLAAPTFGDPTTLAGWGTATGGQAGSAACPDGTVVTSLTGWQTTLSGDWLSGFQFGCSELTLTVGQAVVSSITSGTSGFGPQNPARQSTVRCPSGAVATGLSGRAGLLVDAVTLWCSPLDRVTGLLGAPTVAGTIGGSGGGVQTDQFCADGGVVTGAEGRYGQDLDFLAAVCRPLTYGPATDYALRFPGGTSDAGVVVDALPVGLPDTDVAIDADVRWDGTSGTRGIVSRPSADRAGGGLQEGWSLLLVDGRPCVSATVNTTPSGQPIFDQRRTCAAAPLPVGTWVHLTGVVGRIQRIIVNNTNETDADFGTAAAPVFGEGDPLVIGRLFASDVANEVPAAQLSGFGGDIDDVVIGVWDGEGGSTERVRFSFPEGSGTTTAGPTSVADEGGAPLTATATLTGDLSRPAWIQLTDLDTGPDNTTWPTALTLTSGTAVSGALLRPGEARWYRIPVSPDARVTANLTGLPADYDLTMFKDIGQAFTTLTSPSDLNTLSAEFAGDAFAPSVFSPSVFSPSVFSPSVFSPSVFSPSVFSPSVFSPSVFSPSVFSPSVFSPSVFSPSVFSPSVFSPSVFSPSVFSPSVFSPSVFSPTVFSDAWSSAQTRSIVAVSARDGLADESTTSSTWDNTGYFYLRVIGRGGASSPAAYRLEATVSGGSCTTALSDRSDFALGSYAVPGTRTVILTDLARFGTQSTAALKTSLDGLAAATGGVVVDLNTSPRVRALNTQADEVKNCPYAKNLVAQAARDIVNQFRAADGSPGSLQYVVVAGADGVVPFFRYPDAAGLGPESGYVPPVADNTASQASLRRNTFLSQDAYGARVDVSVKGSELPVPDVAVGRLVETAAEIAAAADAYVASQAPIAPTSSLVTGYDFLTDAADAVAGTLRTAIPTGRRVELITDQSVPPSTTTPANTAPSRAFSWTADDLRTAMFDTPGDVTYLAGHFSANSTLAADYSTSVLSTELAARTNLYRNRLVVSAGCHSGYNIVNEDGIAGLTEGLDWAQAFAQQGATLVAGTGYQYGDTDFLEYSERLYAGLMTELAYTSGPSGGDPVAIGTALVQAKQDYLAATPSMRGIHLKALMEATLFGLPMKGVDLPARTQRPAADPGVTPSAVTGGAAGALGLESATLDLTTGTTDGPSTSLSDGSGNSVTASYLRGRDGIVTNPAEPTLPLYSRDVTAVTAGGSPTGSVLRGIGWLGGSYTDTPGVVPLTGAPTTETNAAHSLFASDAFYPSRLATGNWFDAVADPATGRTRLSVTPAQYRSTTPGSTSTTERRYGGVKLQLFYSGNVRSYQGNVPALASPPTMTQIAAEGTPVVTQDGPALPVSVRVVGDPSAGIQKVWVTYTGEAGPLHGAWTSVDLTQDAADSTLWSGSIPLPAGQDPADVRFVVQAVNGVGLVAMDDNGGKYWTPGRTAPVVAGTTAQTATSLTVSASPATVTYGGTTTASATLSTSSGPVAGEQVRFSFGTATAVGTTNGSGVATATFTATDNPGAVALQAAFDGDATAGLAASSSDPATVTVTKRPTALTLATAAPGPVPNTLSASGVTARLVTPGTPDLPVRAHSVYLAVTNASGTVVASGTRITDVNGSAGLGDVTLPPGSYTVTATFGSDVTLPGGASLPLTDPQYGPSTATGTLTVGSAPTLSGAPPAGRAGQPYSFAFTTGGVPAPTVGPALGSGPLPPGLTLSPGGVLSGTPTEAGSYPVTLLATNGFGTGATLSVTLVVDPSLPATVTAVGGNGQACTAGQPCDAPLRAKVTDSGGRALPGVTVTFQVTSGSAAFGTVKTVTAVTDATGVATSPALVAGTTAGAVAVRATAGTVSTTFGLSVVSVSNARSDLAVTLAAPASAARGATFTTTVTVKNLGPSTAATVVTGLRAGAPLTVVTAPGAKLVSGVWTWTASGLPVGATVTYVVTLKASTTKAATGSVAVATASLVPDPKLGNNAASASVRIP